MDFYASLTINRCHLESLCEIWEREYREGEFPFNRVIVSPLFLRNGILPRLYEHRRKCRVIFDSGGFHIQQGLVDIGSVTRRLRRFYCQNNWAHRFALPDAPVSSLDRRAAAQRKLISTRRQYRTFPLKLPRSFRRKLLPVVHGTTPHEIYRMTYAARRVGSDALGFGGFSTSGPNAGVNSCTAVTLRMLVQFTSLCSRWGLKSHVFGIGGPAAIAVMNYVPVDTFDSAGWIRTAAYGNVYLPYVGAINITGAAISRRSVTAREFRQLRKATGHVCPFCTDQLQLRQSWRHRALHNFWTIRELSRSLRETPVQVAMQRLQKFNRRFADYLRIVLEERALEGAFSHPRNRGLPRKA